MSRELDRLVAILRGPEVAGDDAGPMDAPEVADDERVAAFGLLCRPFGQAEVPTAVLIPAMLGQVGVLVVGTGLGLAPVAVDDVLAILDERPDVLDGLLVDRVAGRATQYRR